MEFSPFNHAVLNWKDIISEALLAFDGLGKDHLQPYFALHTESVPVGESLYLFRDQITYQNFDIQVYLLHMKNPTISSFTMLSDGSRTSLKHIRMIILCIHLLVFERAKLLKQPYEDMFFHLKSFYDLPDGRNEIDIARELLPLSFETYFEQSKTYTLCIDHLKSKFVSTRPNILL